LRSGKWTSKGQYTETYEIYFRKAEVKRYVYQSSEGGKTYCPLEEKAQLIEGATPKFAKTLSSKYAHHGVGRVTADLLDIMEDRSRPLMCKGSVARLAYC
jgi:hypothetical protein